MKKLPAEVEKLLGDKEWQVREEGIKRAVMLGPEYVPALCEVMTDPDKKHYMKRSAANAIFEMSQPGIAALLPIERRCLEGRGKSVFRYLYYYTQDHFATRHGEIGNMLLSIAKGKEKGCRIAAILLAGILKDLRWQYHNNFSSPGGVFDEEREELKKKVAEMSAILQALLSKAIKEKGWPFAFYARLAMTFVTDPPHADEGIFLKALSDCSKEVRDSALRFLEDNAIPADVEYFCKHTDLNIVSWSKLKKKLVAMLQDESLKEYSKGLCRSVLLAAWPELKKRTDSILGISELKSTVETAESATALEASLKIAFYGVAWRPKNYFSLLANWLADKDPSVRRSAITLESWGEIDGQFVPQRGIQFWPPEYPPKLRNLVFRCLWDADPVVRRLVGRLVEDNPQDYQGNVPIDETYWEDHSPEECRKTAEKYKQVIMKELGAN